MGVSKWMCSDVYYTGSLLRGCAKKKKIRDYYVSGWVGESRSHSEFFLENHPKIALNQTAILE